jgi:hypothetical protein
MTRKIKLMMPIMLAAVVLYGFGNGSENLSAEKMNQLGRSVVENAFTDQGFTTRTGTLEATGWY